MMTSVVVCRFSDQSGTKDTRDLAIIIKLYSIQEGIRATKLFLKAIKILSFYKTMLAFRMLEFPCILANYVRYVSIDFFIISFVCV